jgi:ribosomal protein S18 acetylase RimI-like enzyme
MNLEDLTIQRATRLDEAWQASLSQIYTASFPPSERAEFSEFVKDIEEKRRDLYLARGHQGELIGFADIAILPSTKIGYGEYIAIALPHRNKGAGSKLFWHVMNDLKARNLPGFVFEVEAEDEGPEEERDLRKRRIGFYRRNGAGIVECAPSYRMPNLSGGGTLGMNLMWAPLARQEENLTGQFLRDCICDIYSLIYARGPGDPLLQTVLDGLVC